MTIQMPLWDLYILSQNVNSFAEFEHEVLTKIQPVLIPEKETNIKKDPSHVDLLGINVIEPENELITLKK